MSYDKEKSIREIDNLITALNVCKSCSKDLFYIRLSQVVDIICQSKLLRELLSPYIKFEKEPKKSVFLCNEKEIILEEFNKHKNDEISFVLNNVISLCSQYENYALNSIINSVVANIVFEIIKVGFIKLLKIVQEKYKESKNVKGNEINIEKGEIIGDIKCRYQLENGVCKLFSGFIN